MKSNLKCKKKPAHEMKIPIYLISVFKTQPDDFSPALEPPYAFRATTKFGEFSGTGNTV